MAKAFLPLNLPTKHGGNTGLNKKQNMECNVPIVKSLMTTIRGKDAVLEEEKEYPTNISKDQLWPGRGYTPINLSFCTVKFNTQKKNVLPLMDVKPSLIFTMNAWIDGRRK